MTPVQVRRYFRYIALHYLKHFLLLLFGLSFAVVFIDFLQNAHRLEPGANHRILYVFYTWEYMLSLLYPLTILLALAWTQVAFIRQNIFVALYSFGYSRRQLFRPFFFSALGIYLIFLLLQSGEFAYARSKAGAILHHIESQRKVDNLFFKYNGDFVFVQELDPVAKVLRGVTLFHLEGRRVAATIRAPRALYRHGHWVADVARIRRMRYDREGHIVGFDEEVRHRYALLEGYRPRVVKLIYQGRSLSLEDGFRAWKLLQSQGLDSSRIRATLYNMILMPLFALALMPILFFSIRPYRRFVSLEKVWVVSLGASLLTWAFFFAMYRLGVSGTLRPEYGQLLPLIFLIFYAVYFYRRVTQNE